MNVIIRPIGGVPETAPTRLRYCNGISGKMCPVAEMQGVGPNGLIVDTGTT